MYQFEQANDLLIKRSGVYRLLLGAVVVYIGKSSHVPSRVMSHHTQRKIIFDSVEVHWCAAKDMDWIEEYCIRLYRPNCNQDYMDKPPVCSKPIDLVRLGLVLKR